MKIVGIRSAFLCLPRFSARIALRSAFLCLPRESSIFDALLSFNGHFCGDGHSCVVQDEGCVVYVNARNPVSQKKIYKENLFYWA